MRCGGAETTRESEGAMDNTFQFLSEAGDAFSTAEKRFAMSEKGPGPHAD